MTHISSASYPHLISTTIQSPTAQMTPTVINYRNYRAPSVDHVHNPQDATYFKPEVLHSHLQHRPPPSTTSDSPSQASSTGSKASSEGSKYSSVDSSASLHTTENPSLFSHNAKKKVPTKHLRHERTEPSVNALAAFLWTMNPPETSWMSLPEVKDTKKTRKKKNRLSRDPDNQFQLPESAVAMRTISGGHWHVAITIPIPKASQNQENLLSSDTSDSDEPSLSRKLPELSKTRSIERTSAGALKMLEEYTATTYHDYSQKINRPIFMMAAPSELMETQHHAVQPEPNETIKMIPQEHQSARRSSVKSFSSDRSRIQVDPNFGRKPKTNKVQHCEKSSGFSSGALDPTMGSLEIMGKRKSFDSLKDKVANVGSMMRSTSSREAACQESCTLNSCCTEADLRKSTSSSRIIDLLTRSSSRRSLSGKAKEKSTRAVPVEQSSLSNADRRTDSGSEPVEQPLKLESALVDDSHHPNSSRRLAQRNSPTREVQSVEFQEVDFEASEKFTKKTLREQIKAALLDPKPELAKSKNVLRKKHSTKNQAKIHTESSTRHGILKNVTPELPGRDDETPTSKQITPVVGTSQPIRELNQSDSVDEGCTTSNDSLTKFVQPIPVPASATNVWSGASTVVVRQKGLWSPPKKEISSQDMGAQTEEPPTPTIVPSPITESADVDTFTPPAISPARRMLLRRQSLPQLWISPEFPVYNHIISSLNVLAANEVSETDVSTILTSLVSMNQNQNAVETRLQKIEQASEMMMQTMNMLAMMGTSFQEMAKMAMSHQMAPASV